VATGASVVARGPRAVAGFTTDKLFYTGTPPAGTEIVCHGDFDG
jgi:hypothetical protein